jgi:hypothetical protein
VSAEYCCAWGDIRDLNGNLGILRRSTCGYRYVVSFLLGAALIAPAGMLGGTNFQDDHHQYNKQQNRDDKNQKRYYDKSHKDYHNWDDRENRSYQQWTTENHRDNRDFSHLKGKEQSDYWNWRHDHPDDNADRH